MVTFGQIVYMSLDVLKERVDDAYYTEEHIIFLAGKMRAILLERKYRNTRNSTFIEMSDQNKQEICVSLEAADLLPEGCEGGWLKSTKKIPATLTGTDPKILAPSDMLHSMVTWIPPERMPYVGHNKWLRNIIYAARSADGYLYLHGRNPQFMFLDSLKMDAVFADPEEAAKMVCDPEGNACDILSQEFPLEDALVASCVEMIVQELIGSRYAPEDKDNDAKDGLGDAAVTTAKQQKPAEAVSRD